VRDPRPMGNGASTIVVEIAHEALLRHWPALNGWLEEESDALKTLEGVVRSASDWSANGRSDVWLVHTGERLKTAQSLLERSDFVSMMNVDGRDYVTKCEVRDATAIAERAAAVAERERARGREID